MTDVPGPRDRIEAALDDEGVEYRVFEHEPVHTCEEAEGVVPAEVDALHTKNLFLRDQKGARHVLLVTHCGKRVDLEGLAETLEVDKFSLASPRRLIEYPGVDPGAVTPLAVINDGMGAVEVVVDREVWEHERLRAHPLVNTATFVLARDDVDRFLRSTGHEPRVVEVGEAP